jgi:hypothetical protein
MTYPTTGHDRKDMNQEFIEDWKTIEEFPNYDISNYGNIANNFNEVLLEVSKTKQGALKVGLVKDGKQYTRSVKVLVAEAFVKGQTDIFDTPILLDGNQSNCSAWNIEWRPRWHAWNYAYQFNDIKEFYYMGPVLELDSDGIILRAYKHIVDAAVDNGVLFSDVWKSIHTKRETFPTGQIFTLADKV